MGASPKTLASSGIRQTGEAKKPINELSPTEKKTLSVISPDHTDGEPSNSPTGEKTANKILNLNSPTEKEKSGNTLKNNIVEITDRNDKKSIVKSPTGGGGDSPTAGKTALVKSPTHTVGEFKIKSPTPVLPVNANLSVKESRQITDRQKFNTPDIFDDRFKLWNIETYKDRHGNPRARQSLRFVKRPIRVNDRQITDRLAGELRSRPGRGRWGASRKEADHLRGLADQIAQHFNGNANYRRRTGTISNHTNRKKGVKHRSMGSGHGLRSVPNTQSDFSNAELSSLYIN